MLLGKKPIGTIAYLGGVPAVLEEFCFSFAQMMQYNAEFLCGPNEYIHLDRAKVSFHAFARNRLADNMRGDWLLMLDTDHQFEPDLCHRLLDRMDRCNVDVIAGVYAYKNPPHLPTLYHWNENDGLEQIGKWEGRATLFECGSAGAGALMVRRKVFDRIEEELKEGPFSVIHPWGEDHSFFSRLKKLGIKAYFDPRIEAKHLAVKPVSIHDYDGSLPLNEEITQEGLTWQP